MWITPPTAQRVLRAAILGLASTVALVAAAAAAPATADAENTLCLRADSLQKGVACRGPDVAHVGENAEIRRTIEIMGLARATIRFAGCENGLFLTAPATGTASSSYVISYPAPRASGNISPDLMREYLAPITHELAHVLQLETRGGMPKLKRNGERKSLSIELGADFISGIAYARMQATTPAALNSFQQNLKLVGLYKEDIEGAHGTWEQRTTAFRFGVFLKPDPGPIDFRDADLKFETIFPRVLDQGQPSSGLPAIQWNRMSACHDVEQVHRRLKQHPKTALSSCRAPHNSLESGIAKFTVPAEIGRVCFLSESPAPFMDGFSCYQQSGRYDAVLCMRPTDPKLIEEQKSDKNTAIGADYMARTAACATDIEASIAMPTLTPWALSRVAKFAFGYVRSLGSGQPADGQMVHGVATIIRPDSYGGVTAIEYISMYSRSTAVDLGRDQSTAREPRKYGEWLVEVDDSVHYDAELNRLLKAKRMPAWVVQRQVTIQREPGSKTGSTTREAQVQRWQRTLGKAFTDEGFKRIPESDLTDENGRGVLDMLHEFQAKNVEGLAPVDISSISTSMLFFVGQKGLACVVKEPDGILGFVFASNGNDADPDDFGTVFIAAVGLANCGTDTRASKAYLNELLQNSVAGLITVLKGEK